MTGCLALYDPDSNYIYKATHAHNFADCIEFYDDWGYGDHTNLAVYYRMCDWIVQEIFANEAILKTDASRFEVYSEKPLHPDANKHILAFDLIYCCTTYGLFHGITFDRPNSKEKKLYLERKSKAEELAQKLAKAKTDEALLLEAKQYLQSVMGKGAGVLSKAFGPSTVMENNGEMVSIRISSGEIKKLGLSTAVAKKLLAVDSPDFAEQIVRYVSVLRREAMIPKAVMDAEQALEPYLEYLE